jgi:hypothetical protein
MVTTELMNYFKFDEADLAANKMGQLTDKQKSKLRSDSKSNRKWGIVIGLFFLGIASIFPLSFFSDCLFGDNCKTDPGIGPLIGAIVLIIVNLIWVVIWGGIGVISIKGSFSKQEYKLKLAEGPINIVKELSHDSHHHEVIEYELHVGGQVFDVDSTLADFMMQGDVYSFYYLADSANEDEPMDVLSAERV